jgi:hypothetical protein
MDNRISYLNRTFSEYKNALIEMSERYYPELSTSFNDSSIAAWQIDVAADIADNLSYHIDRVYQETNIDSAQERGSLYAIARNNGVKIPGPKGSMAEVKFTVVTGVNNNEPNYANLPLIKRGTRVASSTQEFELLSDVDFASQFNSDGISDSTVTPLYNSNGITTGYSISKLAVVTAGESRIYRHVVYNSDVEPFMEVVIPVEGVMGVESIIMFDGVDTGTAPSYNQFYSHCKSEKMARFYEVDSLAQSYCWTESVDPSTQKAITYLYGYTTNGEEEGNQIPMYSITKGEWRPVDNRFITEYTDKGYLKIIFGGGTGNENVSIPTDASSFAKWQMSKILNNNNLGTTPKGNSTLYILYRVGGGKASNVAKGAIRKIIDLKADADTPEKLKILQTLTVVNTTPSVSGKDMPTEKELKHFIKYYKSAQERCVTVKDYINRILLLPPKYGTPFRVGVMEENNKIMVYLLGINHEGKLDSALPDVLAKNIEEYLQAYRMVNDYVEIKPGRIINLSFDVDVIIDKNYISADVIRNVIKTITDYMDINKHIMGESIYVGDLQKEVGKVDGVINLISLVVNNETDESQGYSKDQITQESEPKDGVEKTFVVDMEATDGILYNDGDTMMEVKYPEKDIRIKWKER